VVILIDITFSADIRPSIDTVEQGKLVEAHFASVLLASLLSEPFYTIGRIDTCFLSSEDQSEHRKLSR
jgi:hypothetical protein